MFFHDMCSCVFISLILLVDGSHPCFFIYMVFFLVHSTRRGLWRKFVDMAFITIALNSKHKRRIWPIFLLFLLIYKNNKLNNYN
jgi:hypothetical protein